MALTRRFDFGGKQVHDANIVATMLAHGETRLLTFNQADFRRFAGLIEEGKLPDGRFPLYIEAVYGRDPDGAWRCRGAEAFDFIQRKTTLSNIPSP